MGRSTAKAFVKQITDDASAFFALIAAERGLGQPVFSLIKRWVN